MFRGSCSSWPVFTVLTRLFSEFDDATTISDFMLSRILHLLEPAASQRLLVEKPHLAALWYFSGQSQVEIQTFGCALHSQRFGDDWPIFPLPIHYAETAGNVELILQFVVILSARKRSMSVPVWDLDVMVNLEVHQVTCLATPLFTLQSRTIAWTWLSIWSGNSLWLSLYATPAMCT